MSPAKADDDELSLPQVSGAEGDGPGAERAPLDEVMLAMDVVDTLRHEEILVARELNEGDRRAALMDRLRRLYAAQGIDVPDRILAEGVEALKQSRFVYTPPGRGLQVRLAEVYADRGEWGKPVASVIGFFVFALFAFHLLVTAPQNRLEASLPRELVSLSSEVEALTRAPEALARAAFYREEGAAALAEGNLGRAQAEVERLEVLIAELARTYDIQIAADAQGDVGVWRIPDVNEEARNYYVFVQAIAPSGERLRLSILSEETGQVRETDRWGLRVTEAFVREVIADREDDGIIQNRIVGRKARGALAPDYTIETTGGMIYDW